MATAWHTPGTKLEAVLRVYFTQTGGNALAGVQILTRFDLLREVHPSLLIACLQLDDAHPSTSAPTGNWKTESLLRIESKIRKTSGAEHDQYCGRVLDLLFDVELVAALNEIGMDEEVQFASPRVLGMTNEVDDRAKVNRTEIRWRCEIIPFVTEPQ